MAVACNHEPGSLELLMPRDASRLRVRPRVYLDPVVGGTSK
ncbi:MAG: hypothetical protein PHS89_02045 [Syntrophaceticus schinkii]|jgi:hypothetical protein|nr:hypothetical protein [Syntrophaceticus schinkii]MDD4260954.1 hypothetical protein [Syntrophaceticus schinkii]MDD4674070.1 hypothetical protein [Syntrophaceticus schinkii]